MSKGNMLLGYARGKVGGMVFRRSGGEQVISAYNGQPKNNRTSRQMYQRSLFLCASKFFTRGVQNLFKFAYEDKKLEESDFNVFMRYNAKRGSYFTRENNEEPTYPAIGRFVMSRGRLTSPEVGLTSDKSKFIIKVTLDGADDNWSHISQQLIERYGCQNGDFLTVCRIVSNGTSNTNYPALNPAERGPVLWTVKTAKIDNNSGLYLEDVFGDLLTATSDGLVRPAGAVNTDCQAFCAIFSRETTKGLRVSTSYLTLNEAAQEAWMNGAGLDTRNQVARHWKAELPAILQGGSSSN